MAPNPRIANARIANTKKRIVDAGSELFRRQGMAGTGLKQIAERANAPFGSIYHFFPGGKNQLTEEVVRTSGAAYRDLVMGLLDADPDLATAIEKAFAAAADMLVATDFEDACPIATVALEVASTDETLRIATADVFTDWIETGTRAIGNTGLAEDARRRIVLGLITSLEGAFVLSRALRDTEPLLAAGRTVVAAVQRELADM